jgi:hypothetical protein
MEVNRTLSWEVRRQKTVEAAGNSPAADSGGAPVIITTGIVTLTPGRLSRSFQSNIPPRNLPFVGREDLLEQMHDFLGKTSHHNIIVLRGQPGVGKSELARQFARTHHDRYPGGIFFIDARPDVVALNLAQLGRTWLGLDFPSDLKLEDQGVRTMCSLGEAPSLLIFDNVVAHDVILPWLPPSGTAWHAIITSVADCWDGGWQVIPVEPLSEAISLQLIEGIAGREVAARYGRRLAALAGGLPVQIVPASTTMRREARRGRIDTIGLTLTREATQSFRGVYAELEPPARLLIHAAARLNSQRIVRDELKEHLTEANGWGEAEFQQRLDMCLDLGVIEGVTDLWMHQLFATFVLDTVPSEDIAGMLHRIEVAQARRMVEIAREVAAAPNLVDLVSMLMAYPVDLHSWKNADALFSIDEVVTTGRALYEIGQFAIARLWSERAVAEKEKGDLQGRIDHESLGSSLHAVGGGDFLPFSKDFFGFPMRG